MLRLFRFLLSLSAAFVVSISINSDTLSQSSCTRNCLTWSQIAPIPDGSIPYLKLDPDTIPAALGAIFVSVTEPPYNAVGDGVTDDTAAITSALAAGTDIYFPPNLTFLTDGHVITSPKRITCGMGTTLLQRTNNLTPAAPEQVLAFGAGSAGSTLEGCIIDGNRDIAKAAYTFNEWACLVLDAPHLTILNSEVKECTTTGIFAGSETNKSALFLDHVYIHDTGRGFHVKYGDFAQLNNVTVDALDNEGVRVFQHGVDLYLSEGFQVTNLRITNMGGDINGLSEWSSAFTILESSGQITNLHVADMVSDTLFHMGVSILSSSITGSSWKILHYAGTSLELFSNRSLALSDFIIDCAYKENAVQTASWGITTSGGGPYFSNDALLTTSSTNLYNRETTLSNGTIKRCGYGIRQSSGNLFLNNVALSGHVHDGIFASDNYLSDAAFPNAPRDTQLRNTVLSNVVAEYNGGAGLNLQNANDVKIHGGVYSNNGQDTTKAATDRGGIVDDTGGAVGPVFLSGSLIQDTQTGTLAANASLNGSVYTGAFVAGATLQFLATKSTEYYEGQRVGLLNICTGVNCSDVDGDAANDDIILRITDVSPGAVTGKILTVSGTYVSVLTTGTGTISSAGTTVTGVGTVLSTQMTGPSFILASSQWRHVTRATTATAALTSGAFSPDLSASSFQISQVSVRLIPSQQYGIRLQQSTDAQLIGNRISGNVTDNHLVTALRHFVTTDSSTPLIAERIGATPVKFSVIVSGNDLGLLQRGNSTDADWISGSDAQVGYVISNSAAFGTADALVIEKVSLKSTFAGQIKSTYSLNLGWDVQNAANQPCNTTCTTGACVVGIDTATPGVFVPCGNSAADTCLCAG